MGNLLPGDVAHRQLDATQGLAATLFRMNSTSGAFRSRRTPPCGRWYTNRATSLRKMRDFLAEDGGAARAFRSPVGHAVFASGIAFTPAFAGRGSDVLPSFERTYVPLAASTARSSTLTEKAASDSAMGLRMAGRIHGDGGTGAV